MKLLYIAGPYRGATPWLVEQNIRAAEALGLLVAERGAVPVIPHTMYRHFDKALPDAFWLDGTLDLLKRCDGIVLLPTWKASAGARAELGVAIDRGMPAWIYEAGCVQPWTVNTPHITDWLQERQP